MSITDFPEKASSLPARPRNWAPRGTTRLVGEVDRCHAEGCRIATLLRCQTCTEAYCPGCIGVHVARCTGGAT